MAQIVTGTVESGDALILFYTDIRRTFRTTLIGYLYQICLHRRVVLLTETLDDETERLLADRTLFPGLIDIVHVGQYDTTVEGLLARYRRLARFARDIVQTWRPSVVFASGVNVFEHSLRRYTKEICGGACIGNIGQLTIREPGEMVLTLNLHSAYARFPPWLPGSVRICLARLRRWLAHCVYYVVVPITTGSRPFLGVNGIHRVDYTRMRGLDFTFVFTRDNQGMLLRSGMAHDKLLVIPHPMKPGAADAVWQAYGIGAQMRCKEIQVRPRIVTCFLEVESYAGFRRDDLSLIPDDELFASRTQVIGALVSALPDWEIRIKPHPSSAASQQYERVRHTIEALSHRIVWVSPSDAADRHIEASGAVVGFPPASTTIYSAVMLCPGIPAMVVDVNRELRGDAYRGMKGVVTVDTWSELAARLATLHAATWEGDAYRHDAGDFDTVSDLIDALPRG